MYAVVFKSTRTPDSNELYDQWSEITEKLVRQIPGFIDFHSHRDPVTRKGITVAYFETEESVKLWRDLPEHLEAQKLGRTDFYEDYEVFVAKVERQYSWKK
jgi:heme-degrading monooxygenase HmoA